MADFNKYIKYMTREPKSVEGLNNTSYFYYYDKLMKMIYTIFKFDDVPPYWNMPYFKEKLFNKGVLAVVDTSAGVLPLECSYDGINIWGMPVYFNINNVVLGNLRGKIGEDGELIYFSVVENTYKSMVQLVDRYASLLANIDGSLNTTLINSRIAQVFEASSNSQLKVMEKIYDQISNGKPAVFVRKNGDEPFEHAIFNNVKNTYIGNDLIITKQSIFNEFKSEIGINNSNTQKKERLITSEVENNKEELNSNIYEWYYNLSDCISKVNAMFNLNISVSFNENVVNVKGETTEVIDNV